MTGEDAAYWAYVALEASGLSTPELWERLRAAARRRPSSRVPQATYADVFEWVTHLVLDAGRDAGPADGRAVAEAVLAQILAAG